MKKYLIATGAFLLLLFGMAVAIAGASVSEATPTPEPRTEGSIVIVKDTDPESNDVCFIFDYDPGADINCLEDDESDTRKNLEPGSYRVIEADKAGWVLTDIDCTGDVNADIDLALKQVTIDLDAGEDVTCEFNNVPVTATPVPPTATPRPPVDVCPNIEGVQSLVPLGMVITANGNCVSPTPQPAPTSTPGLIRPPATGDGGLVGERSRGPAWLIVPVIGLTALMAFSLRRQRS